jgi:hypothetical protein
MYAKTIYLNFSYSKSSEETHYCTECKCEVCETCNCVQFHLDYQEALWSTLDGAEKQQQQQLKAKKANKKKKNKEREKKEKVSSSYHVSSITLQLSAAMHSFNSWPLLMLASDGAIILLMLAVLTL